MRRHLTTRCEITVGTEADILPKLPAVDVLVTMGFTAEMGRAATRLKLVQVPVPASIESTARVYPTAHSSPMLMVMRPVPRNM